MSYKTIIFTGIIVGLFGWIGLVLILFLTLPTLVPRWLFFFFLVFALSGSSMPCIAYLHQRFPVQPPARGSVILREAMFIGIYGSIISWLLQGRVLTTASILFLAAGFVLIEYILRIRERSHWNP